MLNFTLELERIISKWPDGIKWTLNQISDYTGTGLGQVVDYLSDALDREIDLQEALTVQEAHQALDVMKKRLQVQLAARDKQIRERRERATQAYDMTMEKVRALQLAKNWHAAYRTLSYFAGSYEKDLLPETLTTVAGDCIRLGTKANVNMQELGQWLKKAVAAATATGEHAGYTDAFDFLATYGETFLQHTNKAGEKLMTITVESLREGATVAGLGSEFELMTKELGMNTPAAVAQAVS